MADVLYHAEKLRREAATPTLCRSSARLDAGNVLFDPCKQDWFLTDICDRGRYSKSESLDTIRSASGVMALNSKP